MNTQNYNIFRQRIHKSARNKGFPLRVMFELTYQCNFKCKHCYVPQSYRERKGELKVKEVFSLLNQLADIGCFYLGFTGGEPFIREDIMPILWYAKRKGFEIIIYTNGSLINEEIAEELERLRPNKIDITIPAISKTAFESITGVADWRDKVFRAIDLLHKKGVNLGFKTCVLKDNENEIEKIQEFANSLGVLHRLDDMLSPCLDGSREPFRYRGVLKENSGAYPALRGSRNRPHAARQTTNNCDSEDCGVKTMNYELRTMDLFKCGVGVSQAAITPFGELKMCLMIDYPKYKIRATGHTLHATGLMLKEAWERLKKLVKDIRPDGNYQCAQCELEPYCKWCPAKGWLYNRTFTSCEPESHRKARLVKQLLNC